jgi:hypothetical protein
MTLYLFDHHGTLDTLADPTSFIELVRAKHPPGKCRIIIVSGLPEGIPRALQEAADEYWPKDEAKIQPLRDLHRQGFTHVVVSDDMDIITRSYSRALTRIGYTVEVIHPGDLYSLVV